MKRLMYLFILWTLSLAGFAQAPIDKQSVFTEANTAIRVTRDKPEFTLRLKSNPTTGFSWFLREYNSELISPVKHVYEAPANPKKVMGSPGYQVWTFRIKPAGFVVPQRTSIRFVYTRPWEGADSVTQVVFKVATGS